MGVIAMRTGVVWGAAGWLCRSVVDYAIGREGEQDWLVTFRAALESDVNRIDLGALTAEQVKSFRAAVADMADKDRLGSFLSNITDQAVLDRVLERLLELTRMIDRELLDAA